jgi:hypothetical protein
MPDTSNRLDLFAEHLKQEVLVKCEPDTGTPPLLSDAFTTVVLERLVEHNEVGDWTLCAYEDPARSTRRLGAAKLSAWSLSADGATLDLFVSLYLNDDVPPYVTRAEAEKHFKFLRSFLRRAFEGWHTNLEPSNEAFVAMQAIHEAKDSLTAVRLFFLSDGVVKAGQIEEEQMDGLEVRYVLWDLDKLSRLQVGDREVISLDFAADYGGPVPALETEVSSGEYRTYLAFLAAPVLAKIYGQHGQRLLERNVRAFLSTKGKINRGLQQTLKETPHRFLAYNNGLCCTAALVEVETRANGHVLLRRVRDFQIVNGGQTTASIYHAVKREGIDVSGVVVQLKLTVLSNPEHVADIVPLISKFANSQNKVNAADFSANGKFHLEIEKLSRTVWAPATSGLDRGTHWYYERARGSYADDKLRQGTNARIRDWEKQNPAVQKFTKTDLAKFEQIWGGLPQVVCRGAEKNFIALAQRHEDEGEPMVDAAYFKHLVAKMILFKTTERIVTSQTGGEIRAQVVAYTMAWLAEKSGRRIDLGQIWEKQAVPAALCSAISVVAKAAYDHIKAQSGISTEAAKKPECWDKFQSKRIELDPAWEKSLGQHAFIAPRSDMEAAELEWERVRIRFLDDTRRILEMASTIGKGCPLNSGNLVVGQVASLDWERLKMRPGFGAKRIREIVDFFTAAAAL